LGLRHNGADRSVNSFDWVVVAFLSLAVAGASARSTAAAFPGKNGRIAFVSLRDGNPELYAMQPDATDVRRLTRNAAADVDPAWSPEGRRIAFTSDRAGNQDIHLVAIDESGVTRLTTSDGADFDPEWSPDGRRLAFASTRDGEAEIYAMNADGTGQTRLTNAPRTDRNPAWSPDGRMIVFESARAGAFAIYAMSSDGSGPHALTPPTQVSVSPAWSPDGRRIAFASIRDGNYEIYVMNADGSGETRLTTNLSDDVDPAWSPDGQRIAFTSTRDANREIYVMGADGSGQARLTTNDAEDAAPSWETIPIPPSVVSSASFRVRWRVSVPLGALVLAGDVSGPVRASVALKRAGRVRLAATLALGAGHFTRAIRLPRALVPGAYELDVVPADPAFSRQSLPVRLPAPAEGVVASAWASTHPGGLPLTRFAPGTSVVFAHFRFAALPARSRRVTVSWYRPGGRPAGPARGKPTSRVVVAFVGSRNGGPLPRGTWHAVLRAGGTVVKRITFRVG